MPHDEGWRAKVRWKEGSCRACIGHATEAAVRRRRRCQGEASDPTLWPSVVMKALLPFSVSWLAVRSSGVPTRDSLSPRKGRR